jgi:hypothetical protein
MSGWQSQQRAMQSALHASPQFYQTAASEALVKGALQRPTSP